MFCRGELLGQLTGKPDSKHSPQRNDLTALQRPMNIGVTVSGAVLGSASVA